MDRCHANHSAEELELDSGDTEQDRPCGKEELREMLQEAKKFFGVVNCCEIIDEFNRITGCSENIYLINELADTEHKIEVRYSTKKGAYHRYGVEALVQLIQVWYDTYGSFGVCPTPGQIRQRCKAIQAEWKDWERAAHYWQKPSPAMLIHRMGDGSNAGFDSLGVLPV